MAPFIGVMEVHGWFEPDTEAAARDRYEALGGTARITVRELATAMELDRETYEERVTPAVIETAREVLFAAHLRVRTGDREAFEEWRSGRDDEVVEFGHPDVANVAWHHAPFADRVIAATYQDEPDAAVETLRRQAMGHLYRDRI